MSKNSKLIIFDFDGTLTKSILKEFEKIQKVLVLEGYPKITKEQQERFRDMTAREVFKEIGISPLKVAGLLRKNRIQTINDASPDDLDPEMVNVLSQLKEEGYRLGIITSSVKEKVQKIMGSSFDFLDFFYSRGILGKATAISHLTREQGFNKKNVVYVGDEIRDIEAARKAGVRSISVTWGLNSEKGLLKNNPDALAKSPYDLVKLVNKLLQ